jgi:hypothetical protein
LEGIHNPVESAMQTPGSGIDIDQLADQVSELALSQQLIVVPVTPVSQKGWGYLVLLDHNHLGPAEFCALAARAGARLLYVQTEDFNVRTDPSMIVGGSVRGSDHSGQGSSVSDELADFRRYMENYNGRTRQLELAFAVGGVLHCWAVAADWYVRLVNRAAELFPHPEAS